MKLVRKFYLVIFLSILNLKAAYIPNNKTLQLAIYPKQEISIAKALIEKNPEAHDTRIFIKPEELAILCHVSTSDNSFYKKLILPIKYFIKESGNLFKENQTIDIEYRSDYSWDKRRMILKSSFSNSSTQEILATLLDNQKVNLPMIKYYARKLIAKSKL